MTAGVLLGLILAQSAIAGEASQPDLRRIRTALERPAAESVLSLPAANGAVFRMRIDVFDLESAWEERSIVAPYVRPWFRSSHHEYLEQVTPIEFRGATLHPYGIPADQIVDHLARAFKAARRASMQRRARKDVGNELDALLACRADRSKR